MAEIVPSVKIKTKGDISGINGKFNEIRQNLNSCLLKWKGENVNEMQ